MKKIVILPLSLIIILLGAYHALIYYDNNFKYGRMRETPGVKPHEEPLLVMESGVVPFSGGEAIYRAANGVDLKSHLKMDDPAVIKSGEKGYFTYCAQCHGKYHDGNGTVGQSFAPLPTDLRSRKVQSLPEGVHFKEISYGIAGGRQPPLATTIAVEERWQIIAYLKSLDVRSDNASP
jgi:mono/diheme cytochrome c family protein